MLHAFLAMLAAVASFGGLWGAERSYGPQVHGSLVIDGRASEWTATIGGFTVPVTRGATIAFALPGGQGSFSGRASTDGARIEGQWIQPQTVVSGVQYASPVVLRRTQQSVWQGNVDPLEDRLTLYLVVQPRGDGYRAFIRNPEANVGMGRPFKLVADGAHVKLVNTDDATDTIDGSYDTMSDRMTFDFPAYGRFVFTRRDRNDAVGFYPRTADLPYVYHAPLAMDDGWQTSSLAGAGLELAPLADLAQRIESTPTDWFTTPYIQSVLIARHGKLAFEEYFYGFDARRTHDLRSASKTITGVLTGIALDRGAPFAMSSPVYPLLARYAPFTNPDSRKAQITVQSLLTMSSGYACDDNDDKSPGNEDHMYDVSKDFYTYTLDLPMLAQPNSGTAVYCTAGINLVGAVLKAATGMSLIDDFARNFAAPLQIGTYHLNLAPGGDAYMGGGLYLRPRDALKLGQLYLDGGIWNEHRVVSAAWVKQSTIKHSAFPANAYASGHNYGYAWHLFTVSAGGKTYDEWMAQGNGGQLVVVLPALDLTMIITAGNYGNFPTWRTFFEELIPRYVIPAATASRTSGPDRS